MQLSTSMLRTAAALTLFALPAGAQVAPQSNLALMANDHYTRSHDYDLIHQRIVVSRFNWDSASFDGSGHHHPGVAATRPRCRDSRRGPAPGELPG